MPEPPVAIEPVGSFLERARCERAVHDPPFFSAHHDPRASQDSEVLHESRQRHLKRPRQLARRGAARREPRDDRPPRRVGERSKDRVQGVAVIVNHKV